MKIALDYDDTYTKNPRFWNDFIQSCHADDIDVRIVTARHYEFDTIQKPPRCPIIYCNGVAKGWWCHHYENFDPDIWIDDKPRSIIENSTATREWLAEWRVTREG